MTSLLVSMLVNNTSPRTPELEDDYVFDDYNQRIAVAAFTIAIAVFGLIGNFLVLFAVALCRNLQTKVNVFVVNLCIADCIICCVLPFNAVALLSLNGWPLSPYLCASASGFLWIALGAGTVTLAMIAFNRYHVIRKHDFDKAYTSRRLAFMVAIAWGYPTFLTLLATNVGLGSLGYSYKYKACLQDSTHPNSEYLSLFAGIMVFLPSLVVMIFCYIMVFLYVRKHHRHLLRLFIVGDGDRNYAGRDSFVEAGPNTPHSPTQVHFNFSEVPTGAAGDSPRDSQPDAVPQLPASAANTAAATASPTLPSPRTPSVNGVSVEGGLGPRTKSVSEELSETVNRRQADITRNLFYVVCAFLVCLTPYGVAILLPNSEPGIPWVMLLVQFNTCVNPVIYALKHPTFADVIPRILRCDYSTIPKKSAWLEKLLGKK